MFYSTSEYYRTHSIKQAWIKATDLISYIIVHKYSVCNLQHCFYHCYPGLYSTFAATSQLKLWSTWSTTTEYMLRYMHERPTEPLLQSRQTTGFTLWIMFHIYCACDLEHHAAMSLFAQYKHNRHCLQCLLCLYSKAQISSLLNPWSWVDRTQLLSFHPGVCPLLLISSWTPISHFWAIIPGSYTTNTKTTMYIIHAETRDLTLEHVSSF